MARKRRAMGGEIGLDTREQFAEGTLRRLW